MMDSIQQHSPFEDLPEALVEELLDQSQRLGYDISTSLKSLHDKKSHHRSTLNKRGLIGKQSELFDDIHPTTCGIDGSYVVERLISLDIVAVAAIALEGLTPPSEINTWDRPHHLCKVVTLPHNESTNVVARGLMMSMEMVLAEKAPHNVIFIDNSLTTPFIYYNQALNKIDHANKKLSEPFNEFLERGLLAYLEVLESSKDRVFVGMPKYTTKNEISYGVLDEDGFEDRGLLTILLEKGEFTRPVPMERPDSPWHLNRHGTIPDGLTERIIAALDELNVIYYRPHSFQPVFRLEVSRRVADDRSKLSALLAAVREQTSMPGLLEPFPLLMADRMVSKLGSAIPAIRKSSTQTMAEEWVGDFDDVCLSMQGYRTD